MDTGIVIFLIYGVVGVVFATRYSVLRHGVVPSNIENGFVGAWFVAVIWPVAMLMPAFRSPRPCTCRHHVLARQQERFEDERYREALRQEQGEG